MRKFFTFKISDEPYKTTTALNKTVQATYTGLRFLALCVNEQTGWINYVARMAETQEELSMATMVDDDPATIFVVLDASEKTFEAAYLTHNYENEDVADYVEVLPNNLGTWTYSYTGGSIEQNYYSFDIRYINGEFTTPRFREHAVTRESVIDSSVNSAKMVRKALADNDYTDEQKTALEEYASWLENLKTAYADVDHWKIPFPANIPKY
jgi:hypothetical protein